MHRLFVALRPPPGVRSALTGAMSGLPGARWQDDEQLHVTLRFIGEVDRPMAEDIAMMLAAIRHPALILTIDGVGAFDRRGRAHSLWAGIRPREQIAALHRKIDAAMVRLGLPPEGRAYLPHVTLARLNRSAAPVEPWLRDHAGLALPAFAATHFQLYESTLGGEGARYDAVARFALDA
ncbi:RNA 2',3'-cyclic phosphodiesterase [Sphingomonas sp.]